MPTFRHDKPALLPLASILLTAAPRPTWNRYCLPKVMLRVVIACLALHVVLAAQAADPFTFFRPSVVMSLDDRRRLDEGESVARVLPGQDREVAIFAAVPVDADGDRLIPWARNIAALKKSSFVLAIGRFSDPPRLEDLGGLALEDDDLDDLRACRPTDCGLKLTAAEIAQLQAAIAGRIDWKSVLQDGFRRVVLQRVEAYLAHGLSSPAVFSSIVRRSMCLTEQLPAFANYLDRYPQVSMPQVESFIYWSKERFGGKPVISVTHVSMLRGAGAAQPDALVAGKQIFATHYMNGALALTAIVGGGPGSRRYLAYLNRSEVDVLGGFLGGLARWLVERRLKSEASDVLQGLRRRIESGPP